MQDWVLPEIDGERCTRCGVCVEACPAGAVALTVEGPVFVRPEACTYCGLCEEVCPVHAVALAFGIVWETPAEAAGEPEQPAHGEPAGVRGAALVRRRIRACRRRVPREAVGAGELPTCARRRSRRSRCAPCCRPRPTPAGCPRSGVHWMSEERRTYAGQCLLTLLHHGMDFLYSSPEPVCHGQQLPSIHPLFQQLLDTRV